jgi:hypothetical protein
VGGLRAAVNSLWKNVDISWCALKGHGWEAVPLQEFNAQDFPQAAVKPSEIPCLSGNNVRGNP